MKFAIMANSADSFVRPLAQGLSKMFSSINEESKIFYNGLFFLDHSFRKSNFQLSSPKNFAVSAYQSIFPPYKKEINKIWDELAGYDVIIVIEHMPISYLRDKLSRIEEIRKRFPDKPVVLYDLVYLSTLGEWIDFLKNGNDYHGFIQGKNHFGLERYDWYLCVSASTDFPMPEADQPLSLIGCHLDDGSLYPEQKEFRALIDFERPNHMKERAIQIMALEETNTPYTVLHGRYPMAEIRRIYRETSIYFLAHLEAFGLPIAEVEACGGLVFTPYSNWAWAHYQKTNLTLAGSADLAPNFIVYKNDINYLKDKILEAKSNFDGQKNLETYIKYDKRFYHGNLMALKEFVDQLKSGKIHSKLHQTHESLNSLIKTSL